MDEGGQSRRKIIAAAFGSGAVMAALPAKALADAQVGPVGPNGKPGLKLDDLVLYRGGLHGGGGTGSLPGFLFDPGFVTLKADKSSGNAPEIHFKGQRGEWLIGCDVANHGGGGRDFVIAARVGSDRRVGDVVYLTPGPNGARVGIGRTPPSTPFRLETGGQGSDGGLSIVQGEDCTGDALAIFDSGGTKRLSIDSQFQLHAPEIDELRQRLAALETRLAEENQRRRRTDRRLKRGLKRLRKRISG